MDLALESKSECPRKKYRMQSMHLQLHGENAGSGIVDASRRRNDAPAREESFQRQFGQAGGFGVVEIAGSLRIAQSLFSDSLRRYVEL
jgi:hypothetical protein